MRILLVEDDSLLAGLVSESLRQADNNVEIALTVDAGLALLTASRFDVVLLDLHLGKERGEQLIYRADVMQVPIPRLVIFSAQPIAEVREIARKLGAAAVLRKPCTLSEMLASVAV